MTKRDGTEALNRNKNKEAQGRQWAEAVSANVSPQSLASRLLEGVQQTAVVRPAYELQSSRPERMAPLSYSYVKLIQPYFSHADVSVNRTYIFLLCMLHVFVTI
jgi:hypothetical protein